MVCFRRLGHNEQDEPFVTQPLMYKKIAQHPGTRKLYADRLEKEGVIAAGLRRRAGDELPRPSSTRASPPTRRSSTACKPALAVDWAPYMGVEWRRPATTAVPLEKLQAARPAPHRHPVQLQAAPDGRAHARRRGARWARARSPLDWGMAENLAYASLVDEGHPVRLSGQDSGRGTFAHRHAVLHDQNREKWDRAPTCRCSTSARGRRNFLVIDSLLSEEAVLGFEYGYATAQPLRAGDLGGAVRRLRQRRAGGDRPVHRLGRGEVGAPVRPHDAAAARLRGAGARSTPRRASSASCSCAPSTTSRSCVPSTPAQFFHMLRRQMIRPMRKPLIVMTPKSLLRAQGGDLAARGPRHGRLPVRDRRPGEARAEEGEARGLLLAARCTSTSPPSATSAAIEDVALVRIEQLYPFPHDEFAEQIALYPNAKSIVWAQEEPGNQGAWHRIQHYLLRAPAGRPGLAAAQRKSSASPAVGYLALHNQQQKELIDAALTLDAAIHQEGRGLTAAASITEGNDMQVEVKVPQLSESVSEATLVAWHKKVGEAVKRDENLIDIETDKVVLETAGARRRRDREDREGRRRAPSPRGEVIAMIDTAGAGRPPRRRPGGRSGRCAAQGRRAAPPPRPRPRMRRRPRPRRSPRRRASTPPRSPARAATAA